MCPLNSKGRKIIKKFRNQYGTKKGTSIFFSMIQEGKFKGVEGKKRKKK